ncbi:uncharacterized protein K02A2.6-like [Macrosteles quadrilineatus]|uniref:uncharacterized protein K02A2.6-like n=1 Tax=Macrosteles quadrilineatus TaxID=74068 RepID=UPI0023E16853|nr:uncharacterized protein K02A2.6-like [Macrosteles quadrilineatus]
MVSDNATIFTSAEFKKYCSSNGILKKLITTGHAATNGLAERTIQTLKQRLKALEDDHRQIHTKVQEILQQYRATPLSNGQSPAERYLHRRIRIKLDALQPYHPAKNPPSIIRVRTFNVGERVLIREYSQNNKYIWRFGEIIQKLGTLHYIVRLDSGRTLKHHLDQLRKTQVKKVHFNECEEVPNQVSIIPQVPMQAPIHQQQQVPMQVPELVRLPAEENLQPPSPRPRIRCSTRTHKAPDYLKDYVTK